MTTIELGEVGAGPHAGPAHRGSTTLLGTVHAVAGDGCQADGRFLACVTGGRLAVTAVG